MEILRKLLCRWLFLSFGLCSLLRGQYWDLDSSYGPVLEDDVAKVRDITAIPYPGGRLLLGAGSTVINGKIVTLKWVRMGADSTLDPNFQFSGTTGVLAVYPDGRILVDERVDNNTSKVRIRRLNADGTADASFTESIVDNYSYLKATLLTDGRILLYGTYATIDSIGRKGLALLKSDGGLDPSFVSPVTGDNVILNHAVQSSDGQKIILAGSNLTRAGAANNAVAAMSLTGPVDAGFAAAVDFGSGAYKVYPLSGGAMLVAGGSGGVLVRLTATGARDLSFNPTLVGSPSAFGARQSNGAIFYSTNVTGHTPSQELHRMNADGTDDPSFVVPIETVDSIGTTVMPTICDDGAIYVGTFRADRYYAHFPLSRLLPNGAIDSTFNPRIGRPAAVFAFARQTDGKVLLSGRFSHVNNVATPGVLDLVRLNADGSTDSTFSADVSSDQISTIALQPDGKIVLCGGFTVSGSNFGVIRLNSDGSRDSSFHPIYGAGIAGFAVDRGGYIYEVPAQASPVNGRYAPDGTLDPSFQAATSLVGLQSITPLTDGSVLLVLKNNSGNFSITRLLHSGAVDPGFATLQLSATDAAVVALPDGSAAVISRTSAGLYGSYLMVQRLRSDRTLDYSYIPPIDLYSAWSTAEVQALTGSVFDLLRAAASGSSDATGVLFPDGMNIGFSCTTDGKLIVVRSGNTQENITRYQRTSLTSPSMNAAPAIYSTSTITPVVRSANANFFASGLVVAGLSPSCQWYKDGVPIPGKTSPTLVVSSVQVSDSGNYVLVASNAYGSATGPVFSLTVNATEQAARVTGIPSDQTVVAGSTVTFSVVATGTPAPTYQWSFNGRLIVGAKSASLTLANVQEADAGTYEVVVQNTTSLGSFSVTTGATLTVTPAPAALGNRVFFGTLGSGGRFALYVRSSGEATLVGYLPNGRGSFVVKFTVGADGSFSTSLPAGSGGGVTGLSVGGGPARGNATSLPLSGSISGGSLSGTISSTGESMSGAAEPASGTTAALAGLYEAPVINTANGTLYFVVGSSGAVMGASTDSGNTTAAQGTIGADGAFTLGLGGATVQGSINAGSGAVSGQMTATGSAPGSFGGVSATTTHTDRLVNISTRGLVGDGDKAMIAGFVISGSQSKSVLVRASGPTLTGYGLSGAMDDPVLKIYRGQDVILSNDNWSTSADASLIASTAARVGGFAQQSGSKDAALITSLTPGVYSAQVTRADGSATGVALVEVYDASVAPGAEVQKVINISTRGEVGTGEKIMIAGFVVSGNAPKRVLIRAVGPTLGGYGVTGTLADPLLKLYQGETVIASNDDWGTIGSAASDAAALVGAFPLNAGSKDAALLLTLAPGVYSAQVSGVGGTTGVALIEVYEVP